MRQTRILVCLIAVSLLITAVPPPASGQRIPRLFRPAPRTPYRPPVVERPFRSLNTIERLPNQDLSHRYPSYPSGPSYASRISRLAPWLKGYKPGFPTSETDLEKLIRELQANPLLSENEIFLKEYFRLAAERRTEAAREEQLKEEIRQHQKRLKSLGYYSSTIDGIEGTNTKEAVSSFLSDNFPNVPVRGLVNTDVSDLADPQVKGLINLSYDLSVSAKIIHRLDREQRLALVNKSRTLLGFADERESTDIYVASRQLAEIEEKDKYIIKYDKDTKVDVPTQPANLIVVRYYPQRTRQKFEILTGTKATARLYAHLANHVSPSDQHRAIALVPIGKEAHVVTADGIFRLSAQQVASLKRGIALEEPNLLSSEITKAQGKPLVIFNHPLSQKNRGMRQAIGQLAFGLQRSYPQTKIVRSDFSAATTVENISALLSHEVKAPEDVVVVFDRSLDRVKTFGAIENSRSKLQSSGVQIVDYTPGKKWEGGQKKSVIVVTGHINQRLAKFIEELCKDGYFAGNFVVFNSCFELTGLSTRVIEAMRQRCGALAVFRFNTQIAPLKVTEFLDGVAETVRPRQPITLFDLIYRNLPPSMSGGWEAYNWHNVNKDDFNAGD